MLQPVAMLQVPTTPTPWPTVNPAELPFSLPEMSIWDFADDGIQAWNTASQWTQTVQAIILIVLVVGGLFLVISFLRSFTNEEPGGE